MHVVGPLVTLLALPAVGVLVWMAARPRTALYILIALVGLLEVGSLGFVPALSLFYVRLPGYLALPDMMLGVITASVLYDVSRGRRELKGLGPFTWPLLLLTVALMMGLVTGYFNPASDSIALLNSARVLVFLLVVPFLVVSLVTTERHVIRFLAVLFGTIVFKALEGVFLVISQRGPVIEGDPASYFEHEGPWLLILGLLTALAMGLGRHRLPRWALVLVPVAAAAVLLSYRRSMWAATVVGALFVLFAGLSYRGRMRVAVTTLVVLLMIPLTTGLTDSVGLSQAIERESSNPVLQRAQTLTPDALAARKEDIYRARERENVGRELQGSPLLGLGLGVGWREYYALPVEYEGARIYVHATPLSLWIKLGIVGLLGNLALIFVGVRTAFRLRRAPHPLIAAWALGLAGALLGLAVSELSGSHTGSGLRMTILVAANVGLLATAARCFGHSQDSQRSLSAATT